MSSNNLHGQSYKQQQQEFNTALTSNTTTTKGLEKPTHHHQTSGSHRTSRPPPSHTTPVTESSTTSSTLHQEGTKQDGDGRRAGSSSLSFANKQQQLFTGYPDVRVCKQMSYYLRHGAARRGLTIRPDGYLPLADILKLEEFKSLTLADVNLIVNKNPKRRFQLAQSDECTRSGDHNQSNMVPAFPVLTSRRQRWHDLPLTMTPNTTTSPVTEPESHDPKSDDTAAAIVREGGGSSDSSPCSVDDDMTSLSSGPKPGSSSVPALRSSCGSSTMSSNPVLRPLSWNSSTNEMLKIGISRLYIRALQGHSTHCVNPRLLCKKIHSADEISGVCVHGTYWAAWDSIMTHGLNRMHRLQIHFAIGLPGDPRVTSGIRANAEVAIFIDIEKAIADGIEFFISENNVVLSEGINGVIPPKYFGKAVTLPERIPVPLLVRSQEIKARARNRLSLCYSQPILNKDCEAASSPITPQTSSMPQFHLEIGTSPPMINLDGETDRHSEADYN